MNSLFGSATTTKSAASDFQQKLSGEGATVFEQSVADLSFDQRGRKLVTQEARLQAQKQRQRKHGQDLGSLAARCKDIITEQQKGGARQQRIEEGQIRIEKKLERIEVVLGAVDVGASLSGAEGHFDTLSSNAGGDLGEAKARMQSAEVKKKTVRLSF